MLFLQGTRDTLADLDLVRKTTTQLEGRVTLHIVAGADHSFQVLLRSGRNEEQVREELLDAMAVWMKKGYSGDAGAFETRIEDLRDPEFVKAFTRASSWSGVRATAGNSNSTG